MILSGMIVFDIYQCAHFKILGPALKWKHRLPATGLFSHPSNAPVVSLEGHERQFCKSSN
jgi:hypothetical protein